MKKNFKQYISEKIEMEKEPVQKEVSKKKHLLKHTVIIQAQEGDPIKGTKARINIKSLNDCNISGYATFNTYDDAVATYERLTNLDEIVEYLQRNSQRFATASDWAYIVRDEIDTRDSLEPQMPQAPQSTLDDPEAEIEDPEDEEPEVQDEALNG